MRVRSFPWQKVVSVLAFACLVVAVVRWPSRASVPAPTPREAPPFRTPRPREHDRGSIAARSVALVFVATVLFAVGAALGGALTATADDGTPPAAASGVTDTAADVTTAEMTTESTSTDTSPTTTEASSTEVTTAPAPTTTETAPPPVVTGGGSHHAHHHPASSPHQTTAPRAKHHRHTWAPITWVPRVLPDPIPAAHRLSPIFAANLRAAAQAHDVFWWRILAVLRAHGRDGPVPAGLARLDRLARRVAIHETRLNARILSLAHYDRAVGLHGLVTGLEKAKPRLERRILGDARVELSPAGAGDIAAGRVDVRVLVVIRYLAVTFHQVTVSSLITGHPVFARPRVVSAHLDGLAVDISRLHGISIYGNQQVGGVTQRAVEALLRLPEELQAKQVISLLGLGGPSFPQHDHYDHIHVGF
jgi:hypothetical protein